MVDEKTTIAVTLEGEMARRWDAIKKEIGLQKNADLVRLLVTEKFKQLGLTIQLPRFEQINSDESGVKVLDRQIRKVVTVFISRNGMNCEVDKTDKCAHIDFALKQPDIRRILRQKRKEGWKLPDV